MSQVAKTLSIISEEIPILIRAILNARQQPASFTLESMLSRQSAEHTGVVDVAASSQPVKGMLAIEYVIHRRPSFWEQILEIVK